MGTDTKYSVFKKHTSNNSGGYNGLVPVPSYTTTNIRFLREDGTWSIPSDTDQKVLQSASTTTNFRPLILGYNNSTDKSVLTNSVTNQVYTTTTIYAQPSSGTLYANKFIGKIDWSNIDGKPSCFTPCSHIHSSDQITTLTSYVKTTSDSALSTSDSLNIALGKLEYKGDLGVTAYNLVNAAYDGDGTIENLKEILKVLEGIKDTETIKSLLGKYLPLTGGILTGTLTTVTGGSNSYNQGIRINRTATNQWATLLIGKSGTATSGTGTSTAGDGAWLIGTPASSNSLIFNLNNASETVGLCLKGHGNTDMRWNNNTVWHAGNDGSGSGLDADLLDGKHASAFATSEHTHDNRYVRQWAGAYGIANKFLKLSIGDEKGWIRLEVSDSNNGLTGGYGIYIVGWGQHGNNFSDTLIVQCLYANRPQYTTALKVVRTSRNNYDFYFQFAEDSSYPGYTINYSASVTSIDCTVIAVNSIPTATWTSSLSSLQLNASQVDWSGITNKPSVFNPTTHTHPYLPLAGGTMTGVLTLTSGSIEPFDKTALSFINSSNKLEQARIGTDSFNNFGMYSTGTIYIRPNVTLGSSSSNGLIISSSSFTYNGTPISFAGHNHDDRYYTESEINSLLSNKLNTSNFNWTNLPDKLIAGNEFNIVNDGFNGDMWFNYLPINDRSKTASIHTYVMGNGAKGTASVIASGFVKTGSNSSYVLLGDGGHQTISSLSVNYANSAGNADTVDGYHASSLVKFYLSPMINGASADSAKSWFTNTMPSASGAIVYNVPGSEKTIIVGKSSGAYGHMLQLNYNDTYLRILRYYNGSWRSTDWEKISAGYADSAGQLRSKGILAPQTGRTQSLGDVYSYNTNSEVTGGPTTYTSVIGFGRGAAGTIEIAGEWTGGRGLWVRALRDYQDNWYDWDKVLTQATYTEITDSRYYTKTESDDRFVNVTGDIMTGVITSAFESGTWINGVTNAIIKGAYTGYGAILSMPVKDGRVSLSSYPAHDNNIYFGYATTSQINTGTNSFNKQMYWDAANNNLHADVFSGNLVGNASTATKLTSSAGSAILPIYFSDGKPVACVPGDTLNNMINSLSVGTAIPSDNDYYICQYAGGGTTYITYHRRPTSALYDYIKNKAEGTWNINITGNSSSATKLQTARTIWGQSFDGTTNIDNTIRIRQTTDNYCEGIRIQNGDNTWATIILGATADSGTNTNAWSIHRKADNNFAISRNSSDGTNGLVMTSVGMGLGTTAPTHRLDVRGDTRITGSITASSLFINTGDPTLKVYSGRITDAVSDGNICLQTSIDGTDGQSHAYPTQYNSRCNLVLQPRGGQVYIGTNPDGGNTAYKLYVNGNVYASSFTGNASTASKWATARTITLTGSVTGSVSIDGSGNVSLATTTNHTHPYLPLSGGRMDEKAAISWATQNGKTPYIGQYASDGSLLISIEGTSTNDGLVFGGSSGNLLYKGNRVLDAGNYSSYALPKTGGTLTGNLTVKNIIPYSNNSYNIGSTSSRWANSYFTNSIVIGNANTSSTSTSSSMTYLYKGNIELYSNTPFIDFHQNYYNSSHSDYTARIIATASSGKYGLQLITYDNITLKTTNNGSVSILSDLLTTKAILPNSTNTYNIGSDTFYYNNIYTNKVVFNTNTYTVGSQNIDITTFSNANIQFINDTQSSHTAFYIPNISFKSTYGSSTIYWAIGTHHTGYSSGGDQAFVIASSNTTVMLPNSGVNWVVPSDIRYKNIICNMSITTKQLSELPLFKFIFKGQSKETLGTSAQAVQKILPELVFESDKLHLDYSTLGVISGITACKEIEKLKDQIKELQNQLNMLLFQN